MNDIKKQEQQERHFQPKVFVKNSILKRRRAKNKNTLYNYFFHEICK